MKRDKNIFIICFLAPAFIVFGVLFLYPIFRTMLMSFFNVKQIWDPFSSLKFSGIENYLTLFHTYIFRASMVNILKIWIFGGIIMMICATVFATILSSKNVKFRSFWRALIYLPNIISAVALTTMWVQYIYNPNYGLLKSFFSALHLTFLANIQWLSSSLMFSSMLISFVYAAIGYFMLILIAGMTRIPNEYYEYALLEGAGPFICYFKITLPLIRDVYRTCFMFWSIGAINFFTYAQLFTPNSVNESTMVPMLYMYNMLFGNAKEGALVFNVGPAAAIGVVLTIMVLVIYGLSNLILPDKKIEY